MHYILHGNHIVKLKLSKYTRILQLGIGYVPSHSPKKRSTTTNTLSLKQASKLAPTHSINVGTLKPPLASQNVLKPDHAHKLACVGKHNKPAALCSLEMLFN